VGVDLSKVLGLESVDHDGPSHIGIDTIYKSKGQIPEVFLRGAGVPEPFIVQMKALIGAMEPIQFYSCFISHSSKDQDFAERLHADLQAKGVWCWFAPEDLKAEDRFQESIEESIRVYDKVMIVLSEASVMSRWVEREVLAAREREDRENRLVLFPVRIDDAIKEAPQPWAADLRRSRHIGDFRAWHQDPAYRTAFDRLLRDLKASV
jgi:TIR domain